MSAEINEKRLETTENRETKSWFFDKSNKIDRPAAGLSKEDLKGSERRRRVPKPEMTVSVTTNGQTQKGL